MQKSSFEKWLVTLAILIVVAGAIFHLVKSDKRAQAQKQNRTISSPDFSDSYDFHPYYLPSVPRPTNGEPEQKVGFEKLPREKVEAWLAKHNRDAMSLLAAFRALDDTNYLNEAATNFPNNPQVELAVLARDEFPGDRRKWLDLFKASSPSNSLANYLSAQNFFENGNSEEAVRELLAATDKPQFGDYRVDSASFGEELAKFTGILPGEASRMAWNDFYGRVNSQELASLKRLAQGMRDLQARELAASDNVSAQNLAQIGTVLGGRFNRDGGGNLLINQLVGVSIDAIVLGQLNQDTSYDFLGGKTPNQIIQEIKQQKQAIRQTIQDFDAIRPNLTDDEIASYYEHIKTRGEVEAMKWAVQQHPPSNR